VIVERFVRLVTLTTVKPRVMLLTGAEGGKSQTEAYFELWLPLEESFPPPEPQVLPLSAFDAQLLYAAPSH
jgi:hypothetical protein